MGRHGENIRKRKDGRWEGRYKMFDINKDKHIYRSVYGGTYEEVKEKVWKARLGLSCQTEEKKYAMQWILRSYFVMPPRNGLGKSQTSENILPT